jgi:hypothetical protein
VIEQILLILDHFVDCRKLPAVSVWKLWHLAWYNAMMKKYEKIVVISYVRG